MPTKEEAKKIEEAKEEEAKKKADKEKEEKAKKEETEATEKKAGTKAVAVYSKAGHFVREYSAEVHGKNFTKLAEGYAGKIGGEVRKVSE